MQTNVVCSVEEREAGAPVLVPSADLLCWVERPRKAWCKGLDTRTVKNREFTSNPVSAVRRPRFRERITGWTTLSRVHVSRNSIRASHQNDLKGPKAPGLPPWLCNTQSHRSRGQNSISLGAIIPHGLGESKGRAIFGNLLTKRDCLLKICTETPKKLARVRNASLLEDLHTGR